MVPIGPLDNLQSGRWVPVIALLVGRRGDDALGGTAFSLKKRDHRLLALDGMTICGCVWIPRLHRHSAYWRAASAAQVIH